MNITKEELVLYAVTDRAWTKDRTLTDQVKEAIEGGITCLQLREKQLSFEEFSKEAEEIGQLCRKARIPFIINDDVALAKACNADGVHVGQDDMSLPEVRAIVGEKMIIGVSAHTVAEARKAEQEGADYLGVGAVFSTSTKNDASLVTKETLKAICEAVKIPVVAIGGLTKENIPTLKGTGIAGVALVSAIFKAPAIKEECQNLLAITKAVTGDGSRSDRGRFSVTKNF